MTTWKNSGEISAEELQEERRDQHLAQQAPILVDRAQEPGDVEAARDVRQAGPTGHRDQPAVPDRDELLARHEGGPGLRRLDQHLVVGGLGQHHEAAIAQGRDGGEGSPREPRPFGPPGTRLQAEVSRAPDHLRCADLVRAQAVPELPAIGCHILQVQQHQEGLESRVGWSSGVGGGAHRRYSGTRGLAVRRVAARAAAAGSRPGRPSACWPGPGRPGRSSRP